MDSKWLWIGGGAVGLIAAYMLWKNASAAAAAATATVPATATDTTTTTTGTDVSEAPSSYTPTADGGYTDAPDYSQGEPYGEPGNYGAPAFPIMQVAPPARALPNYSLHPFAAPPGYWAAHPAAVRAIVQRHPAWKGPLIRKYPALQQTLGIHLGARPRHRHRHAAPPSSGGDFAGVDGGLDIVYDDNPIY